jgi:glycosyltransferase involved in cell wall biosynthesis
MPSSSVSVIIPNYNHAQYIHGQLNALTSQRILPLEVLVIDDASTDDSVQVIGEFARKHPVIRLLRNERNLGVVATLNRGLNEARGEHWYGGAADDFVAPDFIANIQHLIDRFPQAGIYFGAYRALDGDDREICIEKPRRWNEELFATPERFLNEYLEVEHCTNSLAPATVYRKRYLQDLGGFRPELGHWCDTFLIRSIALKYGAAFTPQILATMRRLDQGYSQSQGRNVKLMLDIVGRAAWLMRSPELRDRFPADHVARWEKGYRDYVIGSYIYSLQTAASAARNGAGPAETASGERQAGPLDWPGRVWARAMRSYRWRKLSAYVSDVSCYTKASSPS